MIGIILAITLNKVTSYYTHTQYEPVKSLAKACQTGHATNIIQGFAVGYESAVVATLVIAVAILLSVLIYAGAGPIFVAYGVAMCGIGMLTLTGNTISMDVFGPVADNANGIGEMGYDREEMGEENYKRARQILADLDAVGNTTKAETKGIAIGSAVIAAVSLFASFIAVMAVGSEDKIGQMTTAQYTAEAGKLSIAYPKVFVGALIGGVVPFLFSSMLIRAVGRAAFLIVKECRVQFRDKEIWAGTKKPDYGRVVNICTATAQSELIGPALLAILMPILVGIFLGTQALGGYLAGMIIVGQLLAVFMANAGGAWDNAKKTIEDGIYGGKGSEAHKAAVTGDTVGDPLKDTAGPALNPLIKVMNMVALLSIAPILYWSERGRSGSTWWASSASSVSPGPSGGARPKARSSARWARNWPPPPKPARASRPSAARTDSRAKSRRGGMIWIGNPLVTPHELRYASPGQVSHCARRGDFVFMASGVKVRGLMQAFQGSRQALPASRLSALLILAEQVLARLKDAVLAGLGGMTGGGGLRLGLQVGEIGLTEGALDDLEVKGQVRGQLGVERIEQEASQLLAAGAGQARAEPDRTQGVQLAVGSVLADFFEPAAQLGRVAQGLLHSG